MNFCQRSKKRPNKSVKRLTGNAVGTDYQVTHPKLSALIERAKALPPLVTAVVYASDEVSLRAAIAAAGAGLIEPVFYGSEARIRVLAEQLHLSLPGRIVDTGESAVEAARRAVKDAADNRVAALMKGSLHTDELMAAVVARDAGLRAETRITHTFVFDLPRYAKLIALTDAVINIAPDVRTKADAITNAVRLLIQLGVQAPKVAILAAVETVHERIPATIDAQALVALAVSGRFGSAMVEGPFGFDNAISATAAAAKGIVSAVAGCPDLLVVPDLNSGNMLYKSFVYVGGGECAGIVQGARVPIILTSRADSQFSRIASCALASIARSKV
ncbi:MAG: bifunctional enoyl-CoA hydratase/phosphate acetyltransferase [Rhizobacter sp.]|nr:bifunctional enoyl-CoA hydratase/phosphate acetyltransferase [Burkholderiales bacterium]